MYGATRAETIRDGAIRYVGISLLEGEQFSYGWRMGGEGTNTGTLRVGGVQDRGMAIKGRSAFPLCSTQRKGNRVMVARGGKGWRWGRLKVIGAESRRDMGEGTK